MTHFDFDFKKQSTSLKNGSMRSWVIYLQVKFDATYHTLYLKLELHQLSTEFFETNFREFGLEYKLLH